MSRKTGALAAKGILTRNQLAAELDITEETVTEWEAGGLPVISVGRKTRLYDLADVIKWMKRARRHAA